MLTPGFLANYGGDVVITCGYCGHPNEDGSVACAGCGTRCEEAPVLPPKSKGRRWWADLRLHYTGYALGVVLFYFLSFGPVMYFFSKVTTTKAATGGITTTSFSVELPGWAGILYFPAFQLFSADWAYATYGRYVSWWIERRSGTN